MWFTEKRNPPSRSSAARSVGIVAPRVVFCGAEEIPLLRPLTSAWTIASRMHPHGQSTQSPLRLHCNRTVSRVWRMIIHGGSGGGIRTARYPEPVVRRQRGGKISEAVPRKDERQVPAS